MVTKDYQICKKEKLYRKLWITQIEKRLIRKIGLMFSLHTCLAELGNYSNNDQTTKKVVLNVVCTRIWYHFLFLDTNMAMARDAVIPAEDE